jgi:tRNA threonylcarbamoyladenosine biosynthesis protein TsaE
MRINETAPVAFETTSPEATEALGRALAAQLPRGSVVALQGDLATGKTCLVRGMADHFQEREDVHSPTFTLVNEYGTDPILYHLDLYRLSGPEELAELGYEEIFDSENLCIIEWPERAEKLLPKDCLRITLQHAGRDHRNLQFHNTYHLPKDWAETLRAALKAD